MFLVMSHQKGFISFLFFQRNTAPYRQAQQTDETDNVLHEMRHPRLILKSLFLLYRDWHSGLVPVNMVKFEGLTTVLRREKLSNVTFSMNEILVAMVMT